jgi:hypothetical protein
MMNEILPETLLDLLEDQTVIEEGWYKPRDAQFSRVESDSKAKKSLDIFLPSLGISLSHYFCYFGLID